MLKLILLPGMDGTGKLFEPLAEQFGTTFEIEAVHYPTDQCLSYTELEPIVRSAFPALAPFVLVAESFSAPLAVLCAARGPSNLRGLVLCTGFVSSPVCGWRRLILFRLAPIVLSRTLPDFATRWFLAGRDAPLSLLAPIQSAISSVRPKVLVHRLRTILTCDVRTELKKIGVPILCLQAERDRLIRPSRLEEILRIKPQVIVEAIAGPHLLLQREPAQSVAAIQAFIERISIH